MTTHWGTDNTEDTMSDTYGDSDPDSDEDQLRAIIRLYCGRSESDNAALTRLANAARRDWFRPLA